MKNKDKQYNKQEKATTNPWTTKEKNKENIGKARNNKGKTRKET